MEKKKRDIATAKTYKSDEVTRYIGAISEEFRGYVKAVAEQYGGLNHKLDAHTEMIGALAEDVAIIKTNIELLKSAVSAKVDYQDFAALEKRMRIVEGKLHR